VLVAGGRDAHGDGDPAVAGDRHRAPDPVGDAPALPVSCGEQHGELLTADAVHAVAAAGGGTDGAGDLGEGLVAGGMAVAVVVGLEVVDVDQHQGGGRGVAPAAEVGGTAGAQPGGELVVEGPPVAQPGEGIGAGSVCELADQPLDPPGLAQLQQQRQHRRPGRQRQAQKDLPLPEPSSLVRRPAPLRDLDAQRQQPEQGDQPAPAGDPLRGRAGHRERVAGAPASPRAATGRTPVGLVVPR
jgi:hypothetical protein